MAAPVDDAQPVRAVLPFGSDEAITLRRYHQAIWDERRFARRSSDGAGEGLANRGEQDRCGRGQVEAAGG